jgi:hypothetical protein
MPLRRGAYGCRLGGRDDEKRVAFHVAAQQSVQMQDADELLLPSVTIS